MGINRLPEMRLYWSNNQMYSNPFVKKTMKRDRFDMLLKCLHFSDNNDPAANQDRLSKMKNIVGLICNQCQQTLVPHEEIVIDESKVPCRGRLVFPQHLPAKAQKYGVKLYKICTPEGFTYDLKIYAGKNDTTAKNKEYGHTYSICMELLKGLTNDGRILYVDNYYTSVKLCKDLLKSKTYVFGIFRSNRKGNPKNVCQRKLKK
jgi:hypothetical protein